MKVPMVKIPKGAITHYSLQGKPYSCMQVPDIVIELTHGATKFAGAVAMEEVPEDWLIRKDGCLFLSRKGWRANKDKMRKAFESMPSLTCWAEFERAARKFFRELREERDKKIASLKRQLKKLQAVKI